MNILYLSYWGLEDGLTCSVIYPQIKYLNSRIDVNKIILVTIERKDSNKITLPDLGEKVIYEQIYSLNLKPNILNKIFDFVLFPKKISEIARNHHVQYALSHSSMGGGLLYLSIKQQIPFAVFYEPHSEYMLDSGVWKRYDPRYIFQSYLDKKQIPSAERIFTVTHKNKIYIENHYQLKNKVLVAPNSVPFDNFSLSIDHPLYLKKQLNIPERNYIGIYVGKFGDIYYDLESFELFKKTFDFFENNFYLIILSPDSKDSILQKLEHQNIDTKNVFVDKVPHEQVPQYLSIANFAFSNIKPAPCRQFCSPIKNGEYWAMGLPILSPDGIGDDSDIIKNEYGGVIYTLGNFEAALHELKKEYLDKDSKEIKNKMRDIALKYRSFEHTKKCLDSIFKK
jgi:glycosyltransferase involved in cell wall biosynthesis